MAKTPKPKAADLAADPAAAAGQDQTAASATAPAAETSTDGRAGSTSAAEGSGEADAAPQPITSVDSVSTSTGGEAAPSGVASDDTPSEHQQPDPAAPATEAAASVEAAAGGDGVLLFGGADDEPELLLGLPPMVEILSGHVPRLDVIRAVRIALDLDDAEDDEAWLALPEAKRQAAAGIALNAMRYTAQAALDINALFDPVPEGLVEITAKSSDGQPFTRAGIVWGDRFQTATVTQQAYDRLVVDPHLTVKG